MPPHDATPGADDRSAGFTLIELLVVMIIIGILAGIALPIFMSQRGKAVDSSMKADVRHVAFGMENNYGDTQVFALPTQSGTTVTIAPGETVVVSKNTTLTFRPLATDTTAAASWAVAAGYCITATNPRGSASGGVKYNSLAGGLTTTSCP
jgi:prepilin-type N-terminal cleavage/methylation domain-containing protein